MDKLLIVIPAYNESENIEELIRQWHPIVEDKTEGSALVIVNDGSTDDTLSVLTSLKDKYSRLNVLDKKNGGHGSAVLFGYNYAVKNGADYVFQTDSDLQTDPSEFKDFWDKREDYEAIFGFRPSRGDGFGRVVVEKVVCILLKLFFGISVPDANAPFRLFKAETLKGYLELIDPDYALPNIILTAFYKYKKNKICFMPISFEARKRGKQSMNIKKIFRVGVKSLTDFRYYRKKIKNGK
jgi:glycosyltransferase involved in cell wall biosynthesis